MPRVHARPSWVILPRNLRSMHRLAPDLRIWQDTNIWYHTILSQMAEAGSPLDGLSEFYVGIHRAMDRLMRANGVSFARLKLLLFIKRNGAVRSTDIAEMFGHAPRTTTEAIDGLERIGLVKRDPDPQDRRAKRISITSEGLAAVEASEPIREKLMREVFAALEDSECAVLANLLGKLNQKLKDLDVAHAKP